MMAEESKDPAGGTTAVADAPEDEAAQGPKPVAIERDALTAEARDKAAEEAGKPVEDLPYAVKAEESLPHSVLALTFEVPAETVSAELDRYYKSLRKEVTLPGFRKGKAPIKLLRIRLGKDGDKEAMHEIATNTARQEVLKRELELVGDAQIVKWTLQDGQPLEAEIHFEVQPTVELKKYKGLEVEVERAEFKPAMIDEELERLRNQHARQESAGKGHAIQAGDAIVVDMSVTGQGGKELGHLGRQNLMIRDFKNELPAELADQVEGRKVGDEVSAEIETERKSRRGETIKHTDTYTLAVRDIKVTRLPEIDDEFAKDLGEYDTLKELKAGIEKQIRARIEESGRQNAVGRLMAALVEHNPVEAPRSLVGQAQYRAMMNDTMQLAQMGLRLEDVVQDSEGYMAQQHQQADMLIKQGLIRAELAKVENLEVSDEDLDKEIERMAEEQGRKPLAVRAKLEADKRLDGLREELLNQRITDFLLENNKVKEVEPGKAEEASKKKTDDKDPGGKDKPKKAAKKTAAKKSSTKAKSGGGAAKAKAADSKPAKKSAPKKSSKD